MKFSERNWYKKIKEIIQKEDIDDDLQNDLWNIFIKYFKKRKANRRIVIHYIYQWDKIWTTFFKNRIDESPKGYEAFKSYIKTWLTWAEWYEIYDFYEFITNNYSYSEGSKTKLLEEINQALKINLSAYRLIDWNIVEINSEEEIKSIEESLEINDIYNPVKTHIRRSLELLSDKKSPDYRNSIKESISAVESLACIITWNKNATLWQALKEIKKNHRLHWSLEEAFQKLYWYTSDEEWIRHKLLEKNELEYEDAMFMLVTCSSFTNLLITKLNK